MSSTSLLSREGIKTTVDNTVDASGDAWEQGMSRLLKSFNYDSWRDKVKTTGGCAQPIHLSGAYTLTSKATGEVLHDYSGNVYVPCGTRRADLCPPCADRYAQDAFHLIRAGLTGDDSKGVDAGVAGAPRLFVTLTAPSFGKVHSRRVSTRGRVIPCECGDKHLEADPRVSEPLDPATYDYEAAVLWQAHGGELWHRWCTTVRRKLAVAGGVRVRDLDDHLRVEYSKVAEFQKRGLIHFHAIVRIDGPTGPGSTAPAWATPELLADVVTDAASSVTMETHRPTGQALTLAWGTQVDPQPITAPNGRGGDESSPERIASYVAKYATKSSGVTESGVDRRIRSRDHIDRLHVREHHKHMMRTAWDLGGLDTYNHLNLRRWTHMLGFRGHFLTKSKVYSTTFTALRNARKLHRFAELLETLDVTEDDIVVINEWDFTGVGHATEAQKEMASAIATNILQTRQSRRE